MYIYKELNFDDLKNAFVPMLSYSTGIKVYSVYNARSKHIITLVNQFSKTFLKLSTFYNIKLSTAWQCITFFLSLQSSIFMHPVKILLYTHLIFLNCVPHRSLPPPPSEFHLVFCNDQQQECNVAFRYRQSYILQISFSENHI